MTVQESPASYELDVHQVFVGVIPDGDGFKFTFNPSTVKVHQGKCSIVYTFDKSNTMGLTFVGAVFPLTRKQGEDLVHINTNGILADIKNVKVNNAGDQLIIKNKNKHKGVIDYMIVVSSTDGICHESQDPQIENWPN